MGVRCTGDDSTPSHSLGVCLMSGAVGVLSLRKLVTRVVVAPPLPLVNREAVQMGTVGHRSEMADVDQVRVRGSLSLGADCESALVKKKCCLVVGSGRSKPSPPKGGGGCVRDVSHPVGHVLRARGRCSIGRGKAYPRQHVAQQGMDIRAVRDAQLAVQEGVAHAVGDLRRARRAQPCVAESLVPCAGRYDVLAAEDDAGLDGKISDVQYNVHSAVRLGADSVSDCTSYQANADTSTATFTEYDIVSDDGSFVVCDVGEGGSSMETRDMDRVSAAREQSAEAAEALPEIQQQPLERPGDPDELGDRVSALPASVEAPSGGSTRRGIAGGARGTGARRGRGRGRGVGGSHVAVSPGRPPGTLARHEDADRELLGGAAEVGAAQRASTDTSGAGHHRVQVMGPSEMSAVTSSATLDASYEAQPAAAVAVPMLAAPAGSFDQRRAMLGERDQSSAAGGARRKVRALPNGKGRGEHSTSSAEAQTEAPAGPVGAHECSVCDSVWEPAVQHQRLVCSRGSHGGGEVERSGLPTTGASRLRQAKLRSAWARMLLSTAVPVTGRAPRRRKPSQGERQAHARFLQRVVRLAFSLGKWARGKLRPVMAELARRRKRHEPRCGGGKNLARESEFAAQRARAAEVLDWYSIYVAVLRRARHGVVPKAVEAFCGGGGTSEGTKRAGGVSHGIDHEPQPDFIRRFGIAAFTQDDATDWSLVKRLADEAGVVGGMASPPCQPYSTATQHTEHQALIPRVRDMLRSLFDFYSIENVAGAKSAMHESVMLCGSMFGLRVARPRLFESNFELHVDEYLRQPAALLESRCCLGERRRWSRYDEHGRARPPCCSGNMFSPLGKTPWRCTAEQCAEAMGVDRSHMSYERLAQSVPPAYAQLRFSQMCMAAAHAQFGVPVITFDQMLAAPHTARRELAMWVRGAGNPSPQAGLRLCKGRAEVEQRGASAEAATAVTSWGVGSLTYVASAEAAHREFYYSHAGGYDQCWSTGYADGRWMQPLAKHTVLAAAPPEGGWCGHNTYVDVRPAVLEAAWPQLQAALQQGSGTRVSLRVCANDVPAWVRRGFTVLEWEEAYRDGDGESEAVRSRPLVWAGSRRGARSVRKLVHEDLHQYMDARDRTGWKPEAAEKATFIFAPMGVDREAWAAASDMPEAVRRLMSVGAEPELGFEVPKREIPQYDLESAEGWRECVWECDRALAVGHLEFVPEDEVDEVRIVHPWQVALKEGKARACQDYSGGLNLATLSKPFGLPTAWDVKRRMCADTHFAKRDLRDGFWAVPIASKHKNLFVLRHPSTGRLVRATSLPFGWADSPRLFCSMTEAIAGEFRRRASDASIDCAIYCFVDDFLLQGTSEAATQAGVDLLDDIMAELGMFWAPHKERGPSRVMEFLGLLLVNVPGLQCIGLTQRRQEKMIERLEEWSARRATSTTADPVELAQLLGYLVFASQVVPGGRTYMQGMLSQLVGLEVDWTRGVVRALKVRGSWRRVQLSGSFWRDLEWWRESLVTRNCVELTNPVSAGAAITGTDASDWGTGQVAYLSGGKDEQQLSFTAAERRRTINWRELLGILRVVESHGERMAGMQVLIEGDNTASLGASTKWSSKAPGMQELIRRLLAVCERWGIHTRFCHTPGVLLHRPDQISRDDLVEEPRARVRAGTFASLERRFGEFTEFLGAEREHASALSSDDGEVVTRAWLHPTYTTVGSALRLVTERATEAGGKGMSAVVLVPDEPTAAWRPLLRHFCVEGRWREGGTQVEMCELGQWRTRALPRATLVLSYPRASGDLVRRVWLGGTRARVQLEGTVLYLPRGKGIKGARGQLYVVLETFDVANEKSTRWSDRGVPTVSVAELLLTDASRSRSPAGAAAHRYEISFRKEGRDRPGGSFYLDTNGGYQPWEVDVDLLYEVGKLVTSHEGKRHPSGGWIAESEYATIARTQYAFNFVSAEAEVAAALRVQPRVSLEMPPPISGDSSDSEAGTPIACVGQARDRRMSQARRAEPLRVRVRSPGAGIVPTARAPAPAVAPVPEPVEPNEASTLRRSSRAVKPTDFLTESVGAAGTWTSYGHVNAYVSPKPVMGVLVEAADLELRVPRRSARFAVSETVKRLGTTLAKVAGTRALECVECGDTAEAEEINTPRPEGNGAAAVHGGAARHGARAQPAGQATERAVEKAAKLVIESAAEQLSTARFAAAEAVLARKRPVKLTEAEIATSTVKRAMRKAAQAGLIDPAYASAGKPNPPMVMVCRNAGIICDGCKLPIGVGNNMVGRCTRVVHHNRPGCAGAQFEEARAVARHAPPAGATYGERCEAYELAMEELYVTTPKPAARQPTVRGEASAHGAARTAAAPLSTMRKTVQEARAIVVARRETAATREQQARARAVEAEERARVLEQRERERALLAQAPPPKVLNRADEVLVAKVSTARTDAALRCMLGQCDAADGTTPRIQCTTGCGRGVHAMCIGMSKSFASLGQLKCAMCRASHMAGGSAPTPLLVRSATKSMLWEVSVGKHSTAQGYAEYQRLENEWVSSVGGGAVALPRDSEESFVAFLIWLAAESGRARSFTTVWRAAAGVCARTREASMTKTARVKRMYNDLVSVLGELAIPCTQITRRILGLMLGLNTNPDGATLAKRCLRSAGGKLILVRSRVLLVFEVMGGLRVGEATGCIHGVKANDVSLLKSLSGVHAELGETAEVEIRDSKTGPGRHVNFVGTSKISKIPGAQYIRDLWKAYGLNTITVIDGGFRVERADYIVVRVSLLGMVAGEVARLQQELKKEETKPTCFGIASAARVSIKYITELTKSLDIAEQRRYVNVAGGAENSDEVLGARRWLIMRGFSRATALTPGPFLRATESGSGALTHMPMQVGSTYTHHCAAMKSAYAISAAMSEPDLELDLGGETVPKFANHSARRAADRVARETRARSEVSIMDIDVVFGWNEAQRRKDMQLHYQGLDRAQRVRRARVTMYM